VSQTLTPAVDPLRQATIARRRRRDVIISTVSTCIFFVFAIGFLVRSPGWPAVRESFFSWPDAKAAWPALVQGFKLTVVIFMTAEPAILALALMLAVLRGLRAPILAPLRILATIYVDVFRGIPTIVLVYLLVFGVPALNLSGVTNSPLLLGWTGLVISYSAYVAEVLRAGLESIHPSQVAAARALGLNRWQTLRHVVVPQAVRRVIPPLLNDFIALQKDTALLFVAGIIELFSAAQIYGNFNFNFTSFILASLFYIALTVPLARYTDRISAKQRARQQGAGTGL
jgi:polar amino acid transport system permease protein